MLLTPKLCFHFSREILLVSSMAWVIHLQFKSASSLPVSLRSLSIGFHLQESDSLGVYHGFPLSPTCEW